MTATNRPQDPPRRSLSELAAWLPGARAEGEATVSGVALTTRDTVPGDLFVAAPGAKTHGARFAAEALAAGAVAVLTDEDGSALLPAGVPRLVVAEPRSGLGAFSARFYDEPAAALTTVGVTGTQGKTSVTHILAAAAGLDRSGSIGSGGSRVRGEDVPSWLTTPEAPQLQALLALFRERGADTAVVEVSSHSLDLGRVDGILFDVAVFLNLGHDHRDFHGTQEAYYLSKRQLFTPERARRAVVNIDGTAGRRLAAEAEIDVATYSIEGREADWTATEVEHGRDGVRFTVHGPGGRSQRFRTRLHGAFSVGNVVAAAAALSAVGRDLADLAAGLEDFTGVEGRMQFLDVDADFTVVVDAAHKPEAINAALRAVRPGTPGRIIAVMGSNGNRDPHKRRLMGRFTATAADIVIVTDDNPEGEDPAPIRAAVLSGARSTNAELHEVADRGDAIRLGVSLARPGDALVIVGKGDERHQLMPEGPVPFSEPDIVAEALAARADG